MFLACNWGLVDVQEKERVCYNITRTIGKDSVRIDSVAYACGETKITTPFDHMLESPF